MRCFLHPINFHLYIASEMAVESTVLHILEETYRRLNAAPCLLQLVLEEAEPTQDLLSKKLVGVIYAHFFEVRIDVGFPDAVHDPKGDAAPFHLQRVFDDTQ